MSGSQALMPCSELLAEERSKLESHELANAPSQAREVTAPSCERQKLSMTWAPRWSDEGKRDTRMRPSWSPEARRLCEQATEVTAEAVWAQRSEDEWG